MLPDCNVGWFWSPRRRSLRSDLEGNEALQGADVSKLVEDVLEDTDMAKFFDEEFEVSSAPFLTRPKLFRNSE